MPVSLRNAVLLFLTITIPLLGFACGSGDLTLDVADPEVVPQEPDFDRVFTIIQRDCVPCHGGAGGGKTAGPGRTATEPGLGDCQQVVRYREDILRTVMNDTMPNGAWPRLTSEEKLIIKRWVENGAPAPCR